MKLKIFKIAGQLPMAEAYTRGCSDKVIKPGSLRKDVKFLSYFMVVRKRMN